MRNHLDNPQKFTDIRKKTITIRNSTGQKKT